MPGLERFWLAAWAAVALILLLALGAGLVAWNAREAQLNARHLASCSGMLMRDLGNRTAALQGRLREWAADPRLQAALASADPQALPALAEDLTRQLPEVLQVRLLTATESLDPGPGSPLSYAGMDMVHQVVTQRRISALEVHRLGEAEAHLAIAGPVLDAQGERVLGVVHAALPLSVLPAAEESRSDFGHVLFQQRAGDDWVAVSAAAAPLGVPDQAVDVPGTRLRVAAWAHDGPRLTGAALGYGGGGLLIALALAGLALYLVLLGVRRAVSADLGGLVALVEDAVNRRPPRRFQYRLAETRPVGDVIAGLLGGRPPGQVAAPGDEGAAPVPSTGHGGADAEAEEAVELYLAPAGPPEPLAPEEVPRAIFRAYDIRGVVGTDLTAKLVRGIGYAVAAEADEAGDQAVVVGRDTRDSAPELAAALIEGLVAGGRDVIDLGLVPTPLLYFATRHQGDISGVMVTGSHNPPEYNGFKVVIGGLSVAGERIAALRERMLSGDFPGGEGSRREADLIGAYLARVERDVAIARTLKVVIECGNGAASVLAPRLYRTLGCELVELNCDPAAGFPGGRVPDPTRPECLEALQARVRAEEADIGLAFDGDGDRLGVVDSGGKIIWPDRVLMLLSADVLSRHPGTDVVFDVKSSRHLTAEILRNSGRPVMWRAGHSPLKAKLLETGALLGGEWSGHIIFQERWYGFDDALYAGARLLEVLALDPRPSAEVFAALPEAAVSTPEYFVTLPEGEPARIMDEVLKLAGRLDGVDVKTIDGLRAEFDGGFGLVRASNTRPALAFRFEAEDEADLGRIQALFRGLMERAAPGLTLPF